MNPQSLWAMALAGVALASALLVPPRSSGQAAPAEDPALTALFAEVTAQQAALTDNQAKIDAQLTAIGENLRQARIYVGRGGGKAP